MNHTLVILGDVVATAGRGWRLAPCLDALFDQADARWPGRSTASDGSIGNAEHAARKSFHNPDASGDVLAGDLTNDPANGPDAHAWAEHLRATRDRRVRTLISNWRICTSYATSSRPAWTWGRYSGTNGHTHHAHVDVLDTAEAKNDLSPWFPPQDGNSNAPFDEDDDMYETPESKARRVFLDYLSREPESTDAHKWAADLVRAGRIDDLIAIAADSDDGRALLAARRKAAGL